MRKFHKQAGACAVFLILILMPVNGFTTDWKVKGFTPEMNEDKPKAFISFENSDKPLQSPPVVKDESLKWVMPNETFQESKKSWLESGTAVEQEEGLNKTIKDYFMSVISKSIPAPVTPKAEDKQK